MKKRGFTLVELLAVIVVIGVILVIVVPRVLKNIDEEKKSAFISSAKALIRKVEYDYMDNEDFDYVSLKTFNINDISMSNYDIDNSTIKMKDGDIYIKLIGKEKFEGYKCIGTINNLNCREKKACTTLKALTSGTTYVNGQYTYTYNGSTGWSVVLTDKESTDPVTTELCGTINDKPIVSMEVMFQDSKATSIDLSSFDTSNVTDMRGMFYYSAATEIKGLENFDTSKVTNMNSMFYYSAATEIKGLENFDTSKVTNMNSMFSGSKVTSLDLSSFDTSSVTDMNSMFTDSAATSLDLSSFDTSNVTDMRGMFWNSKATNLDLSSFDTSKVTRMDFMFEYSAATEIKGLENFDTSKVTNMNSMFYYSAATEIKGLENFDTSNVTNMRYMFSNSRATSLDLSSFDTSNVTNMSFMFSDSKVTSLDLSSFDTSNVTDMSQMFSYSKATTGYARSQEDADRFNASSEKPAGLTFVVKSS